MNKRLSRLTCASIAMALLVTACNIVASPAETPTPAPTVPAAPASPVASSASPVAMAMHLDFKPGFDVSGNPYQPIDVTPSVAPYTVEPALANVVNLEKFPELTPSQSGKLEVNGFFMSPTDQEQLFYIYEDNDYRNIPTFVTTDSVLQAYHVFYNYALRTAETQVFYGQLAALNANMTQQLVSMYQAATEPTVKEQALHAAGYFAVAQLALGEELPTAFPAEILPAVEQEFALVTAAEEFAESPLLGQMIDYSLFTVRGHYTRSEELGRYFTAMSWYGVVPFALYDNQGNRNTDAALRAALMTIGLCALAPEDGGALWENIYSATNFFVGDSDDITPYQFAEVIEKVYGGAPDLNALPAGMDDLYREADALPKPRIVSKNILDSNQIQIRFMGQRYIPDSEILQELCVPIDWPMPSGLDVFAVLGWPRAQQHIETYRNPTAFWPDYAKEFARMRDQFAALDESVWQSNLYYAWLNTLRSLNAGGEGYPMFMQSAAWQDKSLATALASWAELRHDTILYGKASGAERGGGFDEMVPAYVEPNVEVYNKLLWMTTFARENLGLRGLLPEDIANRMERFEELLSYLVDCSVRELRGEDLTENDYIRLRSYGGWLEHLTCSLASDEDGFGIGYWYEIVSDTDRNMAVIADVHTATLRGTTQSFYLEEAVGTAAEIYVLFPANGKLYLGRGAMFDYFEFESDKRLTDEEWQQLVKDDPPPRPAWTVGFVDP